MSIKERFNRLKDAATGRDRIKNLDPELADLLKAWNSQLGDKYYYDVKLKECEAGQTIGELPPEKLRDLVMALPAKIKHGRETESALMRLLLRRKLPLSDEDVCFLVRWVPTSDSNFGPHTLVIKLAEHHVDQNGLSDEMKEALSHCARIIEEVSYATTDLQKLVVRIRKLSGEGPSVSITPGEVWSDVALADIEAADAKLKRPLMELLAHCTTASGGKPAGKWSKRAQQLIAELGEELFVGYAIKWFPLIDKPRLGLPDNRQHLAMSLSPVNQDILKGMIWCCSLVEDADLTRALTALAISAYRKIPGIGPRAVKVGNACVWALGQIPAEHAVAQLAILKVRVKFRTAQKGIEKSLNAAAERAGITREELEEMAVPAYGLEEVGLRRETLGEFTAELHVTGTTSTELRWIKPDGKPQKTVPKSVKDDHADDLKELKAAAKDIQKMLPAQRDRIDGLFLAQKSWEYPVWQQRYIDHPLVGTLGRRVIWSFADGDKKATGIWREDGFVDSEDKPIDWLSDATKVSLWHPLDESTEAVMAWRCWLDKHEVQQPFKQAHREIYVLTDAERNTNIYSNRYASHILKQHQFHALCGVRGWKNQLRLMVDDCYEPANITLPQWGIRAEFWVEGIGEDYGTDTTDSGTYLYLVTDQVRFYNVAAARNLGHASGGGFSTEGTDRDDNHPLPLDQIPPLVFSELMRDVDLFVGVASVGNDPNWSDGGPEGRYRDYWNTVSFGELNATANTRKQVLENLIPRLKIADRCQIRDRFLVVRGDIRTYKIHLGSANILMEPNDQYLCIVVAQGQASKSDKLFLPFEGDNRMAVILSKALMLADDKKIKDQTIISQIKR